MNKLVFAVSFLVSSCFAVAEIVPDSTQDSLVIGKVSNVLWAPGGGHIFVDGRETGVQEAVIITLQNVRTIAGKKTPSEVSFLATGEAINAFLLRQSGKSKPRSVTAEVACREFEQAMSGKFAVVSVQSSPQGLFPYTKLDRMNRQFGQAGVRSIRADGIQLAVSNLDGKYYSCIDVSSVPLAESNSKAGLKLLSWMLDDFIGSNGESRQRFRDLVAWNPNYVASTGVWPTYYEGSSKEELTGYLIKRLNSQAIGAGLSQSPDVLFLRAEWGDKSAYSQYRKIILNRGLVHGWIPRGYDDFSLVFTLIPRAKSDWELKSYFVFLAASKAPLRDVLVAAQVSLGKSRTSDQGIYECLGERLGDSQLKAAGAVAVPDDVAGTRQRARQAITQKMKALSAKTIQ